MMRMRMMMMIMMMVMMMMIVCGHAYQGLGDSSKAEGSAGQRETQSKDSTRGLYKTMQKIEASPGKREIQGKDNTMQSRGSTSQCMVQKIEGSAEG